MIANILIAATAVSAVFAFAAAGLWFWSTKSVIEHAPNETLPGGGYAFVIIDEDQATGKRIDVLKTAARQVSWNRWAALAAGVAALCQALATVLPMVCRDGA